MSSPRWTSILVAEIYYPDSFIPPRPKDTPTAPADWSGSSQRQPISGDNPPPVQDFQNYQQYLQKRAGAADDGTEPAKGDGKKSTHCDGVDEIGCFQVNYKTYVFHSFYACFLLGSALLRLVLGTR